MDTARKAKLGQRWVCFSCAAKFYDLNKPEPLCPKCGVNQHDSPVFKQKPKRSKKAAKKPVAPPPPIAEEAEDDVGRDADIDLEATDADSDDELDLDDLEMGDDEDELSAVEIDED